MYFDVPFTKTIKPKSPHTAQASTVRYQNSQEDNVSYCSSEMNSYGFKNVSLCSINEDVGAGTVRNRSTPFLVPLLTYVLNQTS